MVAPECAPPTRDAAAVPGTGDGPPRLARRPVLLGAAVAALAPLGAGLAGCGSDQPDPVQLMADRATSDAALIDGLRRTPSLDPATADRLGDLAAARRAHAQALRTALGQDDEDQPATAGPSASSVQSAADALYRVREALDGAHEQAARLVLTLPRRTAGLAGSIAACCAGYRAVLS